jgi:uncharacterized protein (TIGR02145 family)
LGAVASNAAITGATNTKITYDAKGLVTAGAAATTADIAASTNKNYVTDAQQTVINNTSGTNTGDQTLPTLSSLGAVASNSAITGATNTKITYDAKGLVTAGAAATTADIAASTNKNYVTDAQQTVIANTSGSNSGDNAENSLYSGLVSNATHTGEVTGSTVLTIANDAVTMAKIAAGAITDSKVTDVAASKITGTLPVSKGGTGATTENGALTNLGAAPITSPTFTGILSAANQTLSGTLGVGTSSPNTSAMVEVDATNKGVLLPRVTLSGSTDATTIATPATSLLVYNTATVSDVVPGYYYNSGTSGSPVWVRLNAGTLPIAIGGTGATTASDALTNLGAAPIASPTFTGDPRAPTATTGTNTTQLATTAFVHAARFDSTSLSDRINAKLNSTVFPYWPGLQKGHIMYWNGFNWVNLNPGTAGQVLKMSSDSDPVPVWGTDATTPTTAFSPCGATIMDIDGNVYNTVLIGDQCWTKENLRVTKYNDGTEIQLENSGGTGGSSSIWQNLTTGARCIYANDFYQTPSNLTKYGYLYNWYAAKGIITAGGTSTKNICPSGWHVPTDEEWTTLTTDLGGESVAGGKIKSVRTFYWNSPNEEATNESGFSALPGGFRITDGSFNNIRNSATFWRATEVNANNAWSSRLDYNSFNVSKNSYEKQYGASIRCLRD